MVFTVFIILVDSEEAKTMYFCQSFDRHRAIYLKSHRPLFLSEKILDKIDHEVDLIQQRRETIREEQESQNRSMREAAYLVMKTASFRFKQEDMNALDQSERRQAMTTRSSASLLGAYVNLERDARKKRSQSIDNQQILNTMIKDHQGIENTRRVFNEIDFDCDGVISLDEFIAAYQKIDAGTSKEHLQKMFKEADVDDSGKLSFDEFLRVARLPNLLAELGTKNRDSRGLIQVQASKERYFGEELRRHSTPGIDSFAMSRSQHFSMELYESRVASLQRFVAMTVMFHQIGYRVQSFFPKVSFGVFGYRMDKTHSIMRIATTASPVSGADVRERMEELRLMLKIERSVQLICRTWKKWKMERRDD
jgi:Ca2+-binding EF-hand superfamily protein